MENKNLYIVATPIGNLKDMTLRAIEILKSVDVIFCEDTRQTGKLLKHYEVNKRMISFHQHSREEEIKKSINQFNQIAYATDAGTPGISDPGNKIVEIALQSGANIIPIPGPCAAISALSVSGLPTDKFLFLGFIPHKGKTKFYETIENADMTVCYYDSPHRVLKNLTELKNHIGSNRKIVVCREMTKVFESIYRGNIDEVIEQVKDKQKGEFVIVISSIKQSKKTGQP
ncbi:MAG: 16S rRNA (cytidine(1402)-2'-O)-methyltransferase [Parcubacteria group bacterium]